MRYIALFLIFFVSSLYAIAQSVSPLASFTLQALPIRSALSTRPDTLPTATRVPPTGLQRLDEHILEQLAAGRTSGQTKLWRTVSNANTPVNIAIPAAVLADGLIRNDPDTKRNALYIASSTLTTYLLNLAIKKLVRRPRPFLTDINLVPVYRPSEYSFPSGHTSSAFSSITALSRAYPKWYVIAPSVLWASAIGYSRMYLGVHYPTDVTAGALLGTGTAFAMGFLRP